MEALLNQIIENNRRWTSQGKVASYIPELSKADPNVLGIYIIDIENHGYFSGDYNAVFTIQSIVKIATLICALNDSPFNEIAKTINVEPSSEIFDTLSNLETSDSHR